MECGEYIPTSQPFGYRLVEGKIEVHEKEAQVVRAIFSRYLSGAGTTEIAKWLNDLQFCKKWSQRAVSRILRNEKYIGDSLWQKTYQTATLPRKNAVNNGSASNYWAKLKQRLKEDGADQLLTNCQQLKMKSHKDGKRYDTDVADTEQLLRIIQSIPSPKAEPFKLWLAQVGRERIEETIDPELTIERALETYLKKGYTREWINQRLQAIQVRKELTDEWDARGVQKGVEYAILTDEISRAWSGMSTRQYKNLKGLKKENLRDNMTTLELVLNMLAEATTTEISKQKAPETFSESVDVARAGGKVAGDARKAIESQTGVPVITSKNAAQLNQVVTDLLEGVATSPEKQDKKH